MIYTVTFNPSLDYIFTVDGGFQLRRTNRTASEALLPGGKGINVSTVLHNLGVDSTALGFTAGFTGEEIKRRLLCLGVKADFIRLQEGFSRINLKMKDSDGTEINGNGPKIGAAQIEELLGKLDSLKEGDGLVLAGSIPSSVPASIYRDILARLTGKGILTVVDATKDLLLNVLEYGPFLVKPNNHELGEIFGAEIKTREEAVPYAKRLREKGAKNVLVSMAGEGAALLDQDGGVHMLPSPRGRLINAVGAGDSMVAGFLAGWMESGDFEHAFRMGVAAGSASAFSEGLASKEMVQEVYARLEEGK